MVQLSPKRHEKEESDKPPAWRREIWRVGDYLRKATLVLASIASGKQAVAFPCKKSSNAGFIQTSGMDQRQFFRSLELQFGQIVAQLTAS
jgi:hypothetical protein